MHIGEKFSGVAQARLNFIEHQQHAILPADCFGFPQESGNTTPASPCAGSQRNAQVFVVIAWRRAAASP
jgi:hypothetical protein